jgi:phage-related protein
MSSIITSVKDLIASVFEVIFSVFRAAFNTTSQLIEAVVNSVIGTFKFVLHTIAGTLEAAGGVGKFIASNIVVIALIAGGGYAYLRYQKSQGRPVRAGNKKLN